jgi:hypothetical protein
MECPEVKKGEWIVLIESEGLPALEARILKVKEDGTLAVGYHKDSIKTRKVDAVWAETFWKVK